MTYQESQDKKEPENRIDFLASKLLRIENHCK